MVFKQTAEYVNDVVIRFFYVLTTTAKMNNNNNNLTHTMYVSFVRLK